MDSGKKIDDYLLVAAIDFGTTFSGFAFSTRFDYVSAPLNISSMTWTAESGNLQSHKTSTCILFDPDGNFDSFGFKAEDKFAELASDGDHEDWYYFKRFKMQLYEQKTIDKSLEITAYDGKKMNALKIFSSAIAYLKEELMDRCNKQGSVVDDLDILWILTVPAIWTEPAKQFMREAAKQASIPNNQLQLVLEPEAAAIYCNKLPLDKMVTGDKDRISVFTPGSKYLVLDAGGGTIDITVQEVQRDGKLREVHKATGGDWGGTMVDREFEKQLQDLVGTEKFESFKKENVDDWLTLNRSFEVKKREEIPDEWVTVRTPYALYQRYTVKNEEGEDSPTDIKWKNDKFRISSEKAKSFFRKSHINIINHIKELLKHPNVKGTVVILMVGGYSECGLLQKAVRDAFPDLRVIVPNEAGLCVLKGAVLFGHEPTIITERVCRMTYGVAVSSKFKPGTDKDEKRVKGAKGDDRCIDVFKPFVKTEESVTLGTPTCPHTFRVSSENATGLDLPVYASSTKAPRYVTDETCQKLGMLKIEIPDTARGVDRGVQVQMVFGGTEIEVKAIDIHTKEEHKSIFYVYYSELRVQYIRPTAKVMCGREKLRKNEKAIRILETVNPAVASTGGTIDITVQEVQRDGKLREVHKATGGDWGGTMVDREFEKQLQDLVGTEKFESFKKENVDDWLTLNRSFEAKKREEIPDEWVTVRTPYALYQRYTVKNEEGEDSPTDIKWKNDKFRISSEKAKSFFRKSHINIINHIKELLKHPNVKGTVVILMVGGYSECGLLQKAVRDAFPDLRVIVPNEAGLCVLKGAVLFGHEPTIITERVCRMTYGVAVSSKFKPGTDKDEKRVKGAKGDDRCIDVFKPFVKTEESVTLGTPTCPHTFRVSSENATGLDLPVYASSTKAPRYVTDETCQKLGMLKIEIPDTARGVDRGVQVQMVFGGTEIEVKAIDIHTKEEHKAYFSFVA